MGKPVRASDESTTMDKGVAGYKIVSWFRRSQTSARRDVA